MTLPQAIAVCSRLTWLQLFTPIVSGLASAFQVSAAGCPIEQKLRPDGQCIMLQINSTLDTTCTWLLLGHHGS
jgi:hypothetical protein